MIAAMRYLAMDLQRRRHPALVASAPLLDLNLLDHMLFCNGCIISHSYVVFSMEGLSSVARFRVKSVTSIIPAENTRSTHTNSPSVYLPIVKM